MSFRTIGWFGPSCPFDPEITGIMSANDALAGMDMYNFNTQQVSDQFPLEIAMKVFWEAATITIDATVTGAGNILVNNEPQVVVVTRNINKNLDWGAIQGIESFPQGFGPTDRAPFADAKDALCGISKNTELFHTGYDSGGNENITFRIYRRPLLFNNKLIAPFVAQARFLVPLDANNNAQGSIFVTPERSIGNAVGDLQKLDNTCLWETPWGNVNSPLYGLIVGNQFFQHVTTGSMTITVTAADPSVRYS